MAMVVIEKQHDCPNLAAHEYLKYLGTKHHDRHIPKDLYAPWSEAMQATLARFHGEDWDEALADQWRQAIENVVDIMFQGYQQHYTV